VLQTDFKREGRIVRVYAGHIYMHWKMWNLLWAWRLHIACSGVVLFACCWVHRSVGCKFITTTL